MDIHRLGLIDSFLRIIDHSDMSNPNHAIAKYFLENYARIGELNIYDVAEECFVSRSSIRRFCQHIGYDNFLDLKQEFKSFDYQYNYFMYMHNRDNFREWYAEEINVMCREVDEFITKDVLVEMAKRIQDSKTVVFLSSYSSSQCVMEFQRPLVLLHKIVQVMTDTNFDAQVLSSLTEKDAVFMVSTSGSFAQNNLETLRRCKADKSIITTSHNPEFKNVFHHIYYLSRDDHSNAKSVKGKFGVLYVFDLLYNIYLQIYNH